MNIHTGKHMIPFHSNSLAFQSFVISGRVRSISSAPVNFHSLSISSFSAISIGFSQFYLFQRIFPSVLISRMDGFF